MVTDEYIKKSQRVYYYVLQIHTADYSSLYWLKVVTEETKWMKR